MQNKLWEDMGLAGKRAILVHHDDLGMTEAGNRAYLELGFPTGSVMAPGAWAPQIRTGDLGVHLVLTSEWAFPRMRPLTGESSLTDAQGYFWPTLEAAWQHIDPGDAERELRAQMVFLQRLGLDITHIDTHMGAVLRPDLAEVYARLALEFRVPALWTDDFHARGLPRDMADALARIMAEFPLPAVRLVDTYAVAAEDRAAWYVDTLTRLGPGVYHLIHHAAVPTPEAQRLPDWERRYADFAALRHPDVRRALGEFVLLTYREVRDALRRYLP
ncbi:carbohydrate deacetylase [Alicyclobacillus cellulosilyticus]|uniref:Carbohydrate deacetylase n=1 Tax=Alicyclobacillus cellulosilyticus TaxID=1003997 RepID=A0A917K9L3_9BACL|nr:ChbG/HpnK family deacetylase [Alicyclobacillus cellulosilyticus]GGJ05447.1 carbohydrate deacetylase [Alicyclobacillus cellulosilyticus]